MNNFRESRAIRAASFNSGVAIAGLALSLAMGATANAQATDADDAAPADQAIVVTGTLLRSVVPAGAQQMSIDAQIIEATGATSTDELLATVPQINSFGDLQTVNSGGTQLTVNRINLRNLPQGVGGSSPTLVLLDGHRIVGVGVKQAYPDPDVIPPLLIQRVDVLTDGGSAIYGSDAVGGVVNFITRNDYDGIKVDFRQGFGEDYYSTDVNFMAGRTWSTGSAFAAYNYSWHNALQGSDRNYIRNIDYTTGQGVEQRCSPANAVVNGSIYAVVGGNSLVRGTANICDDAQTKSYYPEQTRHSVMAGFRQELGASLELDIKAFYSTRRNTAFDGPLTGTATVTSANPNYISTDGVNMANQTVQFDYAPVNGIDDVKTRLWALGVTPTLTWSFGNDWQAKALYNYGKSRTIAIDPRTNEIALGAAVTAGTINPYDIARSDPNAIAQVLDWLDYGVGKDELHNARLIVDGPLFSLPGGDLRVAVGGEFIHERFAGVVATGSNEVARNAPLVPASRDVWSAFGELNIPAVGPENDIPFVDSFTISAAVRYDDYSDFGSNWAPNLGATWKPVDWVGLRARWNKSFQAPSLVQISQASSPTINVVPGFIINFVPLLRNPAVAPNGGPIVAIQGTLAPLDPQKSEALNLGIDVSPPFLDGLDLHFTYFKIEYKGQISTPPLGFGQFFGVPAFEPLLVSLPSLSQLETFLTDGNVSADRIADALAQVSAQGGNAYFVADVRARNLGLTKVDGFDVGFNYRHDVSFGSISASMNATYIGKNVTASDGTNFQPDQAGVDDNPKFTMTGRLGATVGDDFRGQITWRHRSGFDLSVPAQLGQTRVGAFDVFDLFLKYDVDRDGLPPIELSLGINNILDTNPPLLRADTSETLGGYWNGSTIGRVVQLGVGVEF